MTDIFIVKVMEEVLECSQGAAYLGKTLSKAQAVRLKTEKNPRLSLPSHPYKYAYMQLYS